jgi:uncharacterized protein
MIQKIQVALIFLILPLAALYFYAQNKGVPVREIFVPTTPVIHVGEIPLQVDIADTDETRIKGLSGRERLTEVKGLLMVFDKADYHSIWMKDMRFPIDVIWISEDLTVVGITEMLTPESYPKTFRPPVPVKYVLETYPGYAETFGIRNGAQVRLPIQVKPAN